MRQIVAWVSDEVVESIDDLVVSGVFASRSDAVRGALLELIDRHQRINTAQRIVEGYRRRPQSENDVQLTDAATSALIAAEPW